jgi:hypothetical protein
MDTFIVCYLTSVLITRLRHEKYDTYGKVCTEMFVVNVSSMYVWPRFVDFWQFYHLDIALASGTLHWCRRGFFISAVWRKRGRTVIRLVESTHPFSLPVNLTSFGWGEWHLSGFFTVRAAIKSCPFLRFLFVLSPHVAGHFEILSDFFHKVIHNSHKYDRFSILFH